MTGLSNTEMIKVFKKYVRLEGTKVIIGIPGEEPLVTHEGADLTDAKAFVADTWWIFEVIAREILTLESSRKPAT